MTVVMIATFVSCSSTSVFSEDQTVENLLSKKIVEPMNVSIIKKRKLSLLRTATFIAINGVHLVNTISTKIHW